MRTSRRCVVQRPSPQRLDVISQAWPHRSLKRLNWTRSCIGRCINDDKISPNGGQKHEPHDGSSATRFESNAWRRPRPLRSLPDDSTSCTAATQPNAESVGKLPFERSPCEDPVLCRLVFPAEGYIVSVSVLFLCFHRCSTLQQNKVIWPG